MMRSRRDMKNQAKARFRANYWKSVLVCLLLTVLVGSSSGLFSASALCGGLAGFSQAMSVDDNYDWDDTYDDYYHYTYDDGWDDFYYDDTYDDNWDDSYYDDTYDPYFSNPGIGDYLLDDAVLEIVTTAIVIIAIAILIAVLIQLLLSIFIINPIKIGIYRFFLSNLEVPAKLGEVAGAFDNGNYKTVVKTVFLRDIKVILWSLVFIIPGIVKSYQYAAVPFLLAERPDMSTRQVFAASADLMRGNKWRAFVLDLSFIGWHLLSAVTLGLVGIFYSDPYQSMTTAAFYQTICQEKNPSNGPAIPEQV